jgi:hypothetical protein
MSKKVEMALKKFTEGYNCSQSICFAFSEDLQRLEESNSSLGLFNVGSSGPEFFTQ